MKKKARRKGVKKGSIGGYMLSDEQMTALIDKSIVSPGSGFYEAMKGNKNGK